MNNNNKALKQAKRKEIVEIKVELSMSTMKMYKQIEQLSDELVQAMRDKSKGLKIPRTTASLKVEIWTIKLEAVALEIIAYRKLEQLESNPETGYEKWRTEYKKEADDREESLPLIKATIDSYLKREKTNA